MYKKTDRLIKYNNDFNREKYDRVSLMLPKGKKEVLKDKAQKNGESVNMFINKAIDERIARLDTAENNQ